MKRVIGIDPGKSGGIAVIDPYEVEVFKMPTEGDIADLFCMVTSTSINEGSGGPDCLGPHGEIQYVTSITAFIEDIPKGYGGMVNQSTMATLHRNFGFLLGVLSTIEVRTVLVKPQKWQKGIPGLEGKKGPDRKRALKDQAARLFPDVKVTLANCDALLIAEWGRQNG